jgi:UDP-glucose 4-epimerase
MSVYGLSAGTISSDTVPNPKSNYGKSKLQAEEKIRELNDDAFCVSILRPPMVYGKGCRGNYPKLAKITLKIPVFPYTDNRRSMIYIDNLCEFVRIIIDKKSGGVFFPQNDEYVNTSALAKMINEAHGRKIRLLRFLGPPLSRISRRIDVISKVFGDLIYDETLRGTDFDYCVVSFEQSINITENGDCSEV